MITRTTRTLVIDDFSIVRQTLRRFLNDLGLQDIEEAGDGLEGMSKLREAQQVGKPYGLVFLDWSMPKMTGLDMVQQARKMDVFKDIPMVLVTAEGERTQVLKALNSGATDYVVKPFTVDVIRAKIEQINKVLAKKKL